MTWKFSAAGVAGSAGHSVVDHRVGAAALVGLFLAAVSGVTSSAR